MAAVVFLHSPSPFGLAGIGWLFRAARFFSNTRSTVAWPVLAPVAFFMLNPCMPIANALIAAVIAAIITAFQYARIKTLGRYVRHL